MYYATLYPSPLGEYIIVCNGEKTSLTGLWLKGQKYELQSIAEEPVYGEDIPLLESAKDWLNRYFSGQRPDPCELPLQPKGSAFRQRVWQMLVNIPYGRTSTYGELAMELERQSGQKTSARAVGGAVGHNPASIIIPCHRVVGAGSLTGYAGGIAAKVFLLKLEGAALPVPKARGGAL